MPLPWSSISPVPSAVHFAHDRITAQSVPIVSGAPRAVPTRFVGALADTPTRFRRASPTHPLVTSAPRRRIQVPSVLSVPHGLALARIVHRRDNVYTCFEQVYGALRPVLAHAFATTETFAFLLRQLSEPVSAFELPEFTHTPVPFFPHCVCRATPPLLLHHWGQTLRCSLLVSFRR